jgi:hypothetical protein
LVATTPGHTVAVGDTWPNETLSAADAGATSARPVTVRATSDAIARGHGARPQGAREPIKDLQDSVSVILSL